MKTMKWGKEENLGVGKRLLCEQMLNCRLRDKILHSSFFILHFFVVPLHRNWGKRGESTFNSQSSRDKHGAYSSVG